MALRERRKAFARVLGKAATRLQNLGVAGTAAVAAAALTSWPILALGGVAYAALVAWDVASPSFWKKALGDDAPEAVSIPDPDTIKDPALAGALRSILAARAEIAQVLDETPDDVRGQLATVLPQLTELERHSVSLVRRGEELSAYLAKSRPDQARAELAELERKARAARDAEARKGYEDACRARREQLAALDDIGAAAERIVANLATIVATLEALPPRVVRMRALDAQTMDELTGDFRDELQRMNGEVRLFEETLRAVAEVPQS